MRKVIFHLISLKILKRTAKGECWVILEEFIITSNTLVQKIFHFVSRQWRIFFLIFPIKYSQIIWYHMKHHALLLNIVQIHQGFPLVFSRNPLFNLKDSCGFLHLQTSCLWKKRFANHFSLLCSFLSGALLQKIFAFYMSVFIWHICLKSKCSSKFMPLHFHLYGPNLLLKMWKLLAI